MMMKRLTPLICALALAPAAFCQDDFSRILDPVYPVHRNGAGSQIARPQAAVAKARTIQVVQENDVLQKLNSELSKHWNVDGELRISFARGWQPIRIASDDWQVTVSDLPIGGISRSFLVRVRIMAAERAWFDQQLVVQAQLWKPILVAVRRIERGQTLDADSVETQTVDVLRERVAPVGGNIDLGQHEAVQTIAEGKPITWKDISTAPLVRKGATVDVIASDGKISISTKGIAQASAGMGEPVSIRNIDTRKDFQARVIDRNTVRVNF